MVGDPVKHRRNQGGAKGPSTLNFSHILSFCASRDCVSHPILLLA